MHDIAVCAVRIFSAGHDNEIFIARMDDLYVMKRKLIVKGNGNDGFHRTFFEDFSDSYVCDLHDNASSLVLYEL
jgi:hypothetical protein